MSDNTPAHGHDQVTTTIETPDGVVTISTWRSFFTRAMYKWVYMVERDDEVVECRLFVTMSERDEEVAAKVAELAPDVQRLRVTRVTP